MASRVSSRYATCHPAKKRHRANGACQSCYQKARRATFTEADHRREAGYAKRWRRKNPGKLKAQQRRDKLKHNFGMTPADYDRMVTQQRDMCAICGTRTKPWRGVWFIDHDHETGQVRGLLCSMCNLLLGHCRDDARVLYAAAGYLNDRRPAMVEDVA